MEKYWESLFKSGKPIWDFYPADSAIEAVNTFKAENFMKILIPGIGYGRNAKLFLENGFSVTGIEISQSAISIAKSCNIDCKFFNGSVTSMPFDNEIYDGIFCYALIHVLNKHERKRFIESCRDQLKNNGTMIFVAISATDNLFGKGKLISKNRFRISKGLNVFFYDNESVDREFGPYGMTEYREIAEPVKFMQDHPPIRMWYIVCRKL